ncbi:MAG: LPP20 family lipoprotein [Candidatus Cloacimonetes bacterium]|nr:LPP20 family lipoprotein [Candidatus Cloacimonadota bacterium]
MRKLPVIICLLMLFGCALGARKKAKDRPAWVDNPAIEYNTTLYLIAVGSGSNRSQAEDNARANLAKIFSSRIHSESDFEQRYQEIISESSANYAAELDQSDRVKVISSQTLSNIQIGKSWTDDLGQVYTVAYLNRTLTAELYRSKIEGNAARIMSLLNSVLESQGQWETFATLNAASALDFECEQLISQLRIIRMEEADFIHLPYDPQVLQAQLHAAGRKILFRVQGEGEAAQALIPNLQEVVTNLGFGVSDTAQNLIQMSLNIEELKLETPRNKYVRYQLTITVTDEKGKQLLNFNDAGREAHFSFAEASSRVQRTASEKITGEFAQKLQAYLNGKIVQR